MNGLGVSTHDVPDADDFVLTAGDAARSGTCARPSTRSSPTASPRAALGVEPPEWAVRRGWDELPTGRGRDTQYEWFGGDLRGIEQHLDHVERLGANVLYLTPVFPAGSTHRYDSTTFDHVDPLLGGDEALASLTAAAHARGMRVIGDLTLNHVGNRAHWFESARSMGDAPERELFYFDDSLPHGYEAWPGSGRCRSSRGSRASCGCGWPRPPAAGSTRPTRSTAGGSTSRTWRAGGAGPTSGARSSRTARSAARRVAPDRRARPRLARFDLGPGGWDGTMNYAGFMRPAWTWLRGDEPPPPIDREFMGLPVAVPRLDGRAAVATMRAFRAGVPWEATLHSWALLDSHDVARFRTVAGSRALHEVGIGLQATTPGVPMIFAGDELGLEGAWGEDARRTMPWDRPETWDTELLETYRRLLALRRSSDALARGGIRYAHVGADAIAYLRETRQERLLCLAAARRRARSACRSTRSARARSSRSTATRRRSRRGGRAPRGRPRLPRLEARVTKGAVSGG